MLGFIKKIFSSGPSADFEPQSSGDVKTDLSNLVKYIIVRVVDEPSAVDIVSAETEEGMQITIKCNKDDIGKVIGKSGRNIQALRTLVNGAAIRGGFRANVEVEG